MSIYVLEKRHCTSKSCHATKDIEEFIDITILYEVLSERRRNMSKVERTKESILVEGSKMYSMRLYY